MLLGINLMNNDPYATSSTEDQKSPDDGWCIGVYRGFICCGRRLPGYNYCYSNQYKSDSACYFNYSVSYHISQLLNRESLSTMSN